MTKRRPLVYIAGPYTKGDPVLNIRRVIEVAERLVQTGFGVFVPHLTHLWHLCSPHEYEYWLAQDDQILFRCDALLRIPGDSSGADKEMETAQSLSIPTFTDEALLRQRFGL